MSLIHQQEMTEDNLAAKRANGRMTQGPVTPEGKANSAAANLRHGLYCKAQNGAIPALGEDPQEYADLMSSLENNLVEGLESELVQCIGETLWGMKRAKRVQKGVALKRIKSAEDFLETSAEPMTLKARKNVDCYDALDTALRTRGNGPTPDEIDAFVKNFGDNPSPEMQEFFLLLKSLKKLPPGRERKAARRQARRQIEPMMDRYQKSCIAMQEQLDEMHSPENLAALMAPKDDKSLLMQRMEDANLRRLWRLTNILFRVRNWELTRRDVKNEDRPDYVHENTGDDDKMSTENAVFLKENTPNEP